MYALTALTQLAADTVAEQFEATEQFGPAAEPGARPEIGAAVREGPPQVWRWRAALAAVLERATRAVAPRGWVPRLP